jgi:hypothetical protein
MKKLKIYEVKILTDYNIQKKTFQIPKRSSWIIKQQSFFLSFQPKLPLKKYINGETHVFRSSIYFKSQ